ncbi:MAG: hypothetical protein ACOVRN_17620, partial [Flavobacterium sp.]
MAQFLYNGFPLTDMVSSGGNLTLSTTVTGRYLASSAIFPIINYYNSFHSAAPTNTSLQFNIGEYLSGGSPIFPKTILPIFDAISTTGAGSIDLKGGNIGTSTTYPNRFYFVIVGAGGGGGGGGRDGPGGGPAGAARGGGGGGAGATYGKLLNYVSGQNIINYTVGAGGNGGQRGYSSAAPNTSYDGDPGNAGGDSAFNYNVFNYTVNGGSGGVGGIGGDYNGSLAPGGAG